MPNSISLTGNVTRDPELRFTPGGQAVANFSVADNYKRKDKDDLVVYVEITCWNQLAENVVASIQKGTRVTVTGRFQFDQWETDDGSKRSKLSMTAFTVAPDLSWATAEVTKNERKEGGNEPWIPEEAPF